MKKDFTTADRQPCKYLIVVISERVFLVIKTNGSHFLIKIFFVYTLQNLLYFIKRRVHTNEVGQYAILSYIFTFFSTFFSYFFNTYPSNFYK